LGRQRGVYTVQCPEVKHNRRAEIRARGLEPDQRRNEGFSLGPIVEDHRSKARTPFGRSRPPYLLEGKPGPAFSPVTSNDRNFAGAQSLGFATRPQGKDSDPQILGDTTQNVTVSRNSPTFYPRAPPHRRSESPTWGRIGGRSVSYGQVSSTAYQSFAHAAGVLYVRRTHACVTTNKESKNKNKKQWIWGHFGVRCHSCGMESDWYACMCERAAP
jgi:hypothetical protein